MTQIEALCVATKYFEDNYLDSENKEEILDNLAEIYSEKIQQLLKNKTSSEETNRIDHFNRIVAHPEVFVDSLFISK